MSGKSELSRLFLLQVRSNPSLYDALVLEHRFADKIGRKWRFDFAWPSRKIAVELEGGIHAGTSRHTTSTGFREDCHKYNVAAVMGWTVLRGEAHMVDSGLLFEYLLDVWHRCERPTLTRIGAKYIRHPGRNRPR